jgi:hypothetical protein
MEEHSTDMYQGHPYVVLYKYKCTKELYDRQLTPCKHCYDIVTTGILDTWICPRVILVDTYERDTVVCIDCVLEKI